MPRDGDQARRRLRQAALDLFLERGYDATTAAQIAERASVTERTFFRHFADKREALFDGEAALRAELERGVADAPAGAEPLAVLLATFGGVVALLEDNRSFSEPRNVLINSTPALRERALTKEASLVAALAGALRRRGVEPRRADLAAQVGMAAFSQATAAWFEQPDRTLDAHLADAFADLRALTG